MMKKNVFLMMALFFLTTIECAQGQRLPQTRTEAQVQMNQSVDANQVKVVSSTTSASKGMVSVTLKAGNLWDDGTGYQLLLDGTASAYGTAFPVDGAIWDDCNAPETLYDAFNYKIPLNADPVCNTKNIVMDNSITIQIPAGTYDWCVVNPVPSWKLFITQMNGIKDNYVFEEGKKYLFELALEEEGDSVIITVENDVTFIPDFNEDKDGIFIYPNPSKGLVNIKAAENSTVQILDVTGRIIGTHHIDANATLTLNQPIGLYFIRMEWNGKTSTRKIVIN